MLTLSIILKTTTQMSSYREGEKTPIPRDKSRDKTNYVELHDEWVLTIIDPPEQSPCDEKER